MTDPKVRFCPFCGGGTLFIDPDNPTGFGCMKCKRGFQVAVRTDAEPPAPAILGPRESVRKFNRGIVPRPRKVGGGFHGDD